MDYLVDMSLTILFSLLKKVVKNQHSKDEMKAAFLKLRNVINVTYAGDSDFQ